MTTLISDFFLVVFILVFASKTKISKNVDLQLLWFNHIENKRKSRKEINEKLTHIYIYLGSSSEL